MSPYCIERYILSRHNKALYTAQSILRVRCAGICIPSQEFIAGTSWDIPEININVVELSILDTWRNIVVPAIWIIRNGILANILDHSIDVIVTILLLYNVPHDLLLRGIKRNPLVRVAPVPSLHRIADRIIAWNIPEIFCNSIDVIVDRNGAFYTTRHSGPAAPWKIPRTTATDQGIRLVRDVTVHTNEVLSIIGTGRIIAYPNSVISLTA